MKEVERSYQHVPLTQVLEKVFPVVVTVTSSAVLWLDCPPSHWEVWITVPIISKTVKMVPRAFLLGTDYQGLN